jgi:hypothetical protein
MGAPAKNVSYNVKKEWSEILSFWKAKVWLLFLIKK